MVDISDDSLNLGGDLSQLFSRVSRAVGAQVSSSSIISERREEERIEKTEERR